MNSVFSLNELEEIISVKKEKLYLSEEKKGNYNGGRSDRFFKYRSLYEE